MSRSVRRAIGVLAIALVPLLMYAEVTQFALSQARQVALWVPIFVILVDAGLFWVALGEWITGAWDRAGIALVLPLLIAMASWALMMGLVPVPPQLPDGG